MPRKIINSMVCEFNGQPVFSCEIHPAVSANPYIEFSARLEESGTFRFVWTDDDGSTYEAEAEIEIS